MKTTFRISITVLALCLLPHLIMAQEVLTGIYPSKGTAPAKNREAVVQTLPFYDDFSTSNVYPDSTKWLNRNVYVNSGFPLNPITRNGATFDVLDETGCVYDYAISNPFVAEYLYSTTIRLDSVFDPVPQALTPADSVYFSFYYQPQGNGLPPETNDSLVLEFGIPNEYDTTWIHVWSAPGQTLSSFLQENDSSYFKLVMIPIRDLKYFNSNFFFRFYNYASIANQSVPSYRGNEDNWNIDMVYINRDRTIHDTSYPKVCFTGTAPSFLGKYRAMPYKHYRVSPSSSIQEEFEIQISNLDKEAHTLQYHYTVDQVNGNQSYEYTGHPFTMTAQEHNYNHYSFVANLFSLDFDRDSTSYLIRHYISDTSCQPPLTDSLVYHQGFYNYFAYDDGTPEMGYGMAYAAESFAVQYELLELDTIRGVQILFNHTLNNANEKYFDIVVWKDNNGRPGEEYYRLSSRKTKWEDQIYKFAYYEFDRLIRLNGVFYIGIVQQSNGNINVGFDTSKDNSERNFHNETGSWQQSSKSGCIMIRPVLGGNYFIGLEEPQSSEVILYPNPAATTLHIDGIENGSFIEVFDITGKKVMECPYTPTLSVETLRSGLYLLHVTTADGHVINQKITINHE